MNKTARQYQYYRGFPSRYRRERRRRHIRNLIFNTVLLVFFGIGTGSYAFWVYHELTIMSCGGLVVFGIPFCFVAGGTIFFVVNNLLHNNAIPVEAHIVPYFEKSLGLSTSDAPKSGYDIARNCEQLDQIAREQNVAPLTELGLDDDLAGKSLKWRDPKHGLSTIRTLLSNLKTGLESNKINDAKAVIEDLEKLERALQSALEQDMLFCLFLRISRDTRVLPTGVDLNKGSFW